MIAATQALGYCNSTADVFRGFFSGAEKNPAIPDSKCVTYYNVVDGYI